MEREDGFADEMPNHFPAIQIVGLQFGMADRAKAIAETENLLTAHPDQLLADLRSGAIDSLIVQNPFRMGYQSTRAIGLKLAGRTQTANIDSGVTLIRREVGTHC
jgi:ribose transport system substrate-binding protein